MILAGGEAHSPLFQKETSKNQSSTIQDEMMWPGPGLAAMDYGEWKLYFGLRRRYPADAGHEARSPLFGQKARD